MLGIIRQLLSGPRPFTELYKSCPSPSTLSERLTELEAEGILERHPSSARRSHYRLTEKGEALGQVLQALNDWAERWLPSSR
jgi:DNA-binding HxlR family transcriptional regulator